MLACAHLPVRTPVPRIWCHPQRAESSRISYFKIFFYRRVYRSTRCRQSFAETLPRWLLLGCVKLMIKAVHHRCLLIFLMDYFRLWYVCTCIRVCAPAGGWVHVSMCMWKVEADTYCLPHFLYFQTLFLTEHRVYWFARLAGYPVLGL